MYIYMYLYILMEQLPGDLKSKEFLGCIGEAYLDGKHVGLWNFRELEGRCTACGIM